MNEPGSGSGDTAFAPRAKQEIRLLHARIRGRVRVRVPSLYRNPEVAGRLQIQLEGFPGIRRTHPNVLTASLLILYTEDQDLEAILTRVAEAASGVIAESPRQGPVQPVARRAAPVRTGFGSWIRRLLPGTEPPSSAPHADGTAHNWHALEGEGVLEILGTSASNGLTQAEAARRLRRFGPNRLQAIPTRSPLAIFLSQFYSPPVGLLAISAAVSLATGGAADAAAILVVVMINAVIGFVTEREAEQTIQGLSEMTPSDARVLRDGLDLTLPVAHLVPGDLLHLAPGSYVAADLRLIESRRLNVDESALTGESLPVEKHADSVQAADVPLAERVNMAFMGTMVIGGSGLGVVVGTALDSELGRIQTLAEDVGAPETPMQRQLGVLGGQLSWLSGLVCAGVFLVGLLRGQGWLEMLKSSVSLAVAAVPEGLPAVATTTLALGIREMGRHQVAVRHLEAVETLGSVQVFCLDKTGTLTENRMSAVSLLVGDRPLAVAGEAIREQNGEPVESARVRGLACLLDVLALCSEVQVDDVGQAQGSPTELALWELAKLGGVKPEQLREDQPLLEIHQRSEGRRLLSSLHRLSDNTRLIAVKGSPTEVLERCRWWMEAGVPLEKGHRDAIVSANERLAADAQRVLGVAHRIVAKDAVLHTRELVWLGLVGMTDPLRPHMGRLMRMFHGAGIRTVMITGDQSATAQAVGERLGLGGGRPLKILDSGDLNKMEPELLAALVQEVDVFSRVSPAHKLHIVQAYQAAGKVVAMTGDGINDGPALKAADIGVAMGGSGTDVARSVADVVLEDDNLHTMRAAVSQGRTIYGNIRKAIHFLLATNFTEIELMLAGIALGFGPPLSPMQLLWINLLSDIFPGLALSLEPAEPDVMERAPRNPGEPIIRANQLKRMGVESLLITGGALATYGYGLSRYGPGPSAGTLGFQALTTGQLLHALSCRSETQGLFTGGERPRNPYLDMALGGSLALQLSTVFLPPLRRLLGTTPIGMLDGLMVAAGAVSPLLANEALKALRQGRVGTGPETEGEAR